MNKTKKSIFLTKPKKHWHITFTDSNGFSILAKTKDFKQAIKTQTKFINDLNNKIPLKPYKSAYLKENLIYE